MWDQEDSLNRRCPLSDSRETRTVRVLILCTGNSARSQMAEGWLRHLGGTEFEVESAGTHPAGRVNPLAIRAMAEVGVDISGQSPKPLARFLGDRWDYVITVCDRANEECPFFPGGRTRLHWGFDDPAAAMGDEETRLRAFRRVRDEIREQFRVLAEETASAGGAAQA